MTPATGGAASENYYTTLEGLGEAACTEDSEGGLSETPSIKSPFKPSQERQRGRQTHRDGQSKQLGGMRRGAETTGRRRTESHSRAEAGDSEGNVDGQTRSRGERLTRRRDGDFMGRVRHKIEALMGNVEELLLATAEQQRAIAGQDHEEAPCPAIVGMLIVGHEEFAKILMGGDAHTREQSRAAFEGIQWIADRRKTKAETEERAL